MRYLVVCQQTLGSQALLEHLETCRAAGPSTFHILVPAYHPHGTLTWTEGGDRADARHQLRYALAQMRSMGFEVTGEVGDCSPVAAIADALSVQPATFDEIVLCTLAPGVTRRVGQDLPHRVARSTAVPVHHIVATLTRPYRDHEIPNAGTYIIDPTHSKVDFVARFVALGRVRGHFDQFAGTLRVADQPEDSTVAITIDTASVATGNRRRDAHLQNLDFLDVDHHPSIDYTSTGVAPQVDQTWKVRGDLNLLGVTRPVDLDVTFVGADATEWGEQRAGFSAAAHIDRREWGLTWKQPFKIGGLLIGRQIRIELDIQAVCIHPIPLPAIADRSTPVN